MNRDDIIRMAREARWIGNVEGWTFTDYEELERFAALVAAAERQACMEVCWDVGGIEAIACANLIRARGEEPKRHPGYIVGDHWLQAAYTRICTGETEAEVMADYGWQRESR